MKQVRYDALNKFSKKKAMEFSILKGHKLPEAKGLCVVIDVLRAFTTAAYAFHAGAKEIVFISDPQEALLKYEQDPSLLLMGEVEGIPIPGFHFGNSPNEIRQASLSNRRLVQRTSSGTQGVIGCSHAPHILVSSFVVANATLKRILEIKPSHVSFIVTGRNNGDEDFALAEYLKSKLSGQPIDFDSLAKRVRSSPCGQRMLHGEISYPDGALDLDLALDLDRFPFAMEVFRENGDLVGRAAIPQDSMCLAGATSRCES